MCFVVASGAVFRYDHKLVRAARSGVLMKQLALRMKQHASFRLGLGRASLENRLPASTISGLDRTIRDLASSPERPLLMLGHDFSHIPIHAATIMQGSISIPTSTPSESSPSEG